MGTGRRWFHRGQCRRKWGNCSVAASSSFQRCFYCSTSSLADGLTSPQPACLTMAVVISDQGWSTLKTTTVILECMQRNQEVLQACWNLKNCSQAGCGLAGFLHNCWYWVVRLAVMVARGVGGLQRSLPAFSNRDIHWHWFWFNEHWNVQLQGYVCFPDLRIFEVCEQHALNSDNQRKWYFLWRVIILFLKNTCAVYVCSISVLHTPP